MEKDKLLERISKKEESIAKINRRIDKWKKQCPEGHIEIAEQFRHSTYSEFAHYCKEHSIPYSFTPVDELRRAYQDLDESEITLNKYKNQLELVEAKEGQEKIPVLVEFFKRYKKEIVKFIEFNMPTLLEYYRINSEHCEWHNSRNYIMRTENLTEEEWKKRGANIIIYANQLMRAEVPAMQKAAEMILENHRAEECDSMLMPFKDIIRLIPAEG